MTLQNLPTLNACLNATAGILLFCGWRAIKAGKQNLHAKLMVSAFAMSVLFLCSYLTYHFMVPGVTKYEGQGILRLVYFMVLLTHTPLAAIVPPVALIALYHAHKKNFESHTRITKWLFPVWMYVSVTGVVIYLMLYVF
jgi:putative membrane protein